MREVRVSITRITLEYFQVDLKHEGRWPSEVVADTAKHVVEQTPDRHRLPAQQQTLIVTEVREI